MKPEERRVLEAMQSDLKEIHSDMAETVSAAVETANLMVNIANSLAALVQSVASIATEQERQNAQIGAYIRDKAKEEGAFHRLRAEVEGYRSEVREIRDRKVG